MNAVPTGCSVEILGASRQLAALPRLVSFLRRTPPDVLIANMEHMNVMAVLARAIAGARTRIIACQHSPLSSQMRGRSWKWQALPRLFQFTLPFADAIVAVSAGVADDLASHARLPLNRVDVIYNGVVDERFDERAAGDAPHPWFVNGQQVVLALGRLVPAKDFQTLIAAFARCSSGDPALRLIILGEGPLRAELEAQVRDLGLDDRIALPGFVTNPLPWLRRARLFVMSSRYEGFGIALVEALACGTPVVSTDCPFGPAEILAGGRWGRLTPVGDIGALAGAIRKTLTTSPSFDALRERGWQFSMSSCAAQYAALIGRLRGTPEKGARV